MKISFYIFKYTFLILFLLNNLKFRAEDFSLKNNSEQQSQILIESDKQSSDLENLVFYAEGDVIITNSEKDFIAKSKEAIFNKSSGKIKLIGDVEVVTSDSSKIRAGEMIYYLKENNFKAVSNLNQRVNTKFVFNKKKKPNQTNKK